MKILVAVFAALLGLTALAAAAASGSVAVAPAGTDCLGTGGDTATRIPAPTPRLRDAGITTPMLTNAATIVRVGQHKRLPRRAWIIAVATAMQESSLLNTPGGDRDSVGLFQQRPSQGWGSYTQVHDPVYASTQFYNTLVQIRDWHTLPLTVVAQRVQKSGYPDAYAKHESTATAIITLIAGTTSNTGGDGCGPIQASGRGSTVVAAATKWLGTKYVFAGGDKNGPTTGTEPGIGFDCSGLSLYAWAKVGVTLPHTATGQSRLGQPVPRGSEQPGDLLFFHNPGDQPGFMHHVGIYVAPGRMINAPNSQSVVRYERIWSDWVTTRRY